MPSSFSVRALLRLETVTVIQLPQVRPAVDVQHFPLMYALRKKRPRGMSLHCLDGRHGDRAARGFFRIVIVKRGATSPGSTAFVIGYVALCVFQREVSGDVSRPPFVIRAARR